MSINHHNYEEYFILYMDNELSSDQRRMVEAFVQQHSDLKEELDILLQYKLTPDASVVYAGKEDLMKVNGDTPITLTNYEEWLVLYMDNELTLAQKATVDQFLAANPIVKKEFALLQRTQLQPEAIIFADKASLYRTEEKVKPMPVRWWRIAAAAILLLGVGITTAVLVNKKPAVDPGIAKGISPEKKTVTENPVITPKETDNTVDKNAVAENNNNQQVVTPVKKQDDATNTATVVTVPKNIVSKDNKQPVIIPQVIKEEPVVVKNDNKPTNNLPTPLENPNIIKNDAANAVIASVNPKETMNPKNALTNNTVTNQNPQPSEIVNASYTNTGDAGIDQSNDKKNKSRGLFRKIARTFEKRTNIDPTDDNKLLVAGLAIRLK